LRHTLVFALLESFIMSVQVLPSELTKLYDAFAFALLLYPEIGASTGIG
jgi:hypothetical protein